MLFLTLLAHMFRLGSVDDVQTFICRCIQVADQPVILTGFSALNKLLGREVYSSQMQLGGPKVHSYSTPFLEVLSTSHAHNLHSMACILKHLHSHPHLVPWYTNHAYSGVQVATMYWQHACSSRTGTHCQCHKDQGYPPLPLMPIPAGTICTFSTCISHLCYLFCCCEHLQIVSII